MAYERLPVTELVERYGIDGVHPAADLLPLMTDDEFEVLCRSVEEVGFQNPIRIDNAGLLIDGRNRLQVGWAIGLDPTIIRYQPIDTVGWVIRENVTRRHLTTGQRAVLASDLANMSVGNPNLHAEPVSGNELSIASIEAIEEPVEPPPPLPTGRRAVLANDIATIPRASALRSQDDAASELGVSRSSVQRVTFIEKNAPELIPAVRAGAPLDVALKAARKKKTEVDAHRPVEEPTKSKPTTTMLTLRTNTGIEVPYPQPQGKHTFNQTNEAVDWARWTWNPVTGCLHGCGYCYARDLATKPSYAAAYPVGFTPLFHTERLDDPVNTKIPDTAVGDPRYGRVFVGSMTDLFGEWVPKDWIDAVFESCLRAPGWEYLFLTKFPQRYRRIGLPPSCWFGTSVDTQKRVKVAEKAMAELDVKVRWLSIEPLLEPIEFTDLSWCDLMVIGAQSGTTQPDGYHRGFAPDFRWVASLVAQADAAGVPVFLKSNLMGTTTDQMAGMALPQEHARLSAVSALAARA